MSIMIDMPPAMVDEAREYATAQGTTLERMFLDYLQERFLKAQKNRGADLVRKLHAIRGAQPKLEGAPYRFCRQDAYEEDLG